MQQTSVTELRRQTASQQALLLAAVYAIIGLLWIVFSDRFVAATFPAEMVTTAQTYKGEAFVGVTALAALWLSFRAFSRQSHITEALAASESKFRSYLQHAPMAVFVVDATGRCMEANERATVLLGYTMAELLTLSLSDIAPQEPRDAIGPEGRAALLASTFVDGEYLVRRRDGREIWIAVKAVRVDGPRLLAFAYEITDRKLADAQLRQAAAVFASTHEGVVITDARARVIAANPAFTAITGYTEAEVVGADPRILQSGVQNRDWYRGMWRTLTEAGYWQGEIWNRRKNGEIYPEWLTISAVRDANGATVNYVGQFTDISRLKHSEAQLDHLVHTDALTGLPNRLLLSSRVAHALDRAAQEHGTVAVLSINLDRFKQVNDSHGFEAGDEILKLVADRLRANLRPPATLARLGADEFIVVLEDIDGEVAVAEAARTLVNAFSTGFSPTSAEEVRLGASIGISLFPVDGQTVDALLQHAAAAVTYVKNAGGRGFCFHTRSMADSAQARFALETALHGALDRGEFVLHYQPRVSLKSGRIEGVEALVRWNRPDGVLVAPADFIPVAETTGLIGPIGDWVLGESCRQMRRWLDEGCVLGTMAVNASPRQFRDPGFVDRIRTALAETGIPAERLEIEVTEHTIMDTGPEADARLAALGALGVRIAIDDFGAGYSSLANLRRLPVHTLKIDQAFLKDVPADRVSTGVVLMITALAAHLHLQTVAEGVETEAQRALLAQAGCDLVQGFLFSRPVAPEDIAAQVKGQHG